MKKNKMMRLASAMMVMTLMTTSVISGTFAKYTTQDSGSDVARVAKWGVELQVVGSLYGEKYLKATNNHATSGNNDLTVKSESAGTNVVAPGTTNAGNGFSFFLKGEPEVASKVTVDIAAQNIYLAQGEYGVLVQVPSGTITEANYADLKGALFVESSGKYVAAGETFENTTYYTVEDQVNTPDYYPVVYTLDGHTTNGTVGIATDSLKAAADAILTSAKGETAATTIDKALYTGTITKDYPVNTDLAGLKLDDTNLTWTWAFGADDKVGDNADDTDKADTILGNLIEETTATVVKKGTDSAYYVVTVEEIAAGEGYSAYSVAKVDDTIVACLTTQFNIDITVTQID